MSITAHGTVHSSAEEANARIAELNQLNMELGASDGRVTEILLITEAMQAAGWEKTPREAARPAPKPARRLSQWASEQIMESERELAAIKRSGYDDGKWRYLRTQDDEGRVAVRREYKTQAGFLTAFVRELRRGNDILIAE